MQVKCVGIPFTPRSSSMNELKSKSWQAEEKRARIQDIEEDYFLNSEFMQMVLVPSCCSRTDALRSRKCKNL
jgi:hypothetical protein